VTAPPAPYLPHPLLPDCGTWSEVPAGFEVAFTLRAASAILPGETAPRPDFGRLARALGSAAPRFVRTHQEHGRSIALANDPGAPAPGPCTMVTHPADGLVTDEPRVALAAMGADCPALLVMDPRTGTCGSAHCGWRGTALGIARTLLDRLTAEFGSAPADVHAFIGPGIGPCCFEVGPEVFDALANAVDGVDRFRRPGPRRDHLDLAGANRAALEAAGVHPDRIHDARLCTRCSDGLLFSFRRDGVGTGHHAGIVWRRA